MTSLKSNGIRRQTFVSISTDICVFLFSLAAITYLHFNTQIPDDIRQKALPAFLVVIAVKIFWNIVCKLYEVTWQFASVKELLSVARAMFLSLMSLTVVILVFQIQQLPSWSWSLLVFDGMASFLLITALRFARRVADDGFQPPVNGKKPALIYGAGAAASRIVREMVQSPSSTYIPVAILDDDQDKHGTLFHGIRVVGGRKSFDEVARTLGVRELIIALPSASATELRSIIEHARKANIKSVKVVPSLDQLISGEYSLSNIRDISVEDLLGRQPVEVCSDRIGAYIRGRCVMITGAAGSIGSELARQTARFKPAHLILLEIDETEVYYLNQRMREEFPELRISYIVGDVRDTLKMERSFKQFRPQIIFHAAAYKHVPIMEEFPDESVKVNVLGTKVIAEAAVRWGVERFVLISTDKAVNPTSVMGATKRVAEMLVHSIENPSTAFITVRFGNVLGSRGSVVPIFTSQIKRGGPVTVTHPDMRRYFMTPTEAVLLVLQAGAIGQGGEVFVLDMGEPSNILDMAREMIRLSGLEPDRDIPIVFTGIRKGEKLFEEILTAEEGMTSTECDRIFIAKGAVPKERAFVRKYIDELVERAEFGDRQAIFDYLRKLVPTYSVESTSGEANPGAVLGERPSQAEKRGVALKSH